MTVATGTFTTVTVNTDNIGFTYAFGAWPGTILAGYVMVDLIMIDLGDGTSRMQIRIMTEDGTGAVPADLFDLFQYTDADSVAYELDSEDAEITEATGQTTWLWPAQAQSQWVPDTSQTITLTDPVTAVNYNCDCDDETGYETLAQLRSRLMVRLGYAGQVNNPPPGMAALLNDFIVSSQRLLYMKYTELRTERFFTWTMEPGVRLYDLPGNEEECTKRLNALKLTWVGVEDLNGAWLPMASGIPPEFYTGITMDGVPSRYEIRQCIEVFPPPDEAYKLRIKGHYKLQAMTADGDQTTIDSELVFLWALANAKAHYGHPDANNIASMANDYLGRLVGGKYGTKRYVPGSVPASPAVRPVMKGGYDA